MVLLPNLSRKYFSTRKISDRFTNLILSSMAGLKLRRYRLSPYLYGVDRHCKRKLAGIVVLRALMGAGAPCNNGSFQPFVFPTGSRLE
jgi:hypothetical protein